MVVGLSIRKPVKDSFVARHRFTAQRPAHRNIDDRLAREAQRHAEATIAHSLEANNQFFLQERERLDRWADDMVLAAEKELADTKAQIKAMNRQARLAVTLEEQHSIQEKTQLAKSRCAVSVRGFSMSKMRSWPSVTSSSPRWKSG